MPVTYNGIGTRYSGHRNAIARDALCPHCHKPARLQSYDTTLFFVILFIPIIPLSKKRIIDQCPRCTRHYAVPLAKYHEARDRDYAEANRSLAAAATADDAAKAVASVLQYREPDVIDRMIRAGDAKFAGGADWDAFLIDVNRFLSRYAEAEAAAARSLATREDVGVRYALAEFQFARDDVDAGRATLEPLLAAPNPPPSLAVRLGAEALQRRGRHREALELMSRVAIPADAPADLIKAYAKLRATSEKTLAKSLADPDKFETEADGMIVRRKRVRFARARWVAAAAALIAIGYCGYAFFLGESRGATLVNGTNVAYTATVNGRAYTLQPHEFQPIRVREGDIAMSIAAPGYAGPATSSFSYSRSFFVRPFDTTALVLNPDGLASIVTTEVTYGAAGGSRPAEVHAGEVGYALPGIDYAFVDPPASVSTKRGEDPPRYQVAFVDRDATPSNAADGLRERHEEQKAAAVARRALAWPVVDAEGATWATELLGPAESLAALAPRVAARPIERESHRLYQNLREADGKQAELRAEYERLLAADPNDGTLLYLLGRVRDDDPSAALALYRRAEGATPPEPMGYSAEAYQLAARGDFEPALDAARAARKAMPQNSHLAETEWDLLMATRRHAEAMALLGPTPPRIETPGNFRRRIETLFAVGRSTEIEAAIAARQAQIAREYGPADAEVDARIGRMTLAYLRHNERGYADACPVDRVAALRFPAAISRRDFAESERLLDAENGDVSMDAMLLYLAAEQAGKSELAARSRDRAIASLRKGTVAATTLGAWLAGEREPTEQQLREWQWPAAAKSVALATLAAARPSLRPICAPLAERFGYSATYPHEIVAASLRKSR